MNLSEAVKPLTWVLGVVLLLVGVAGFFVSGNMLLYFEVDPLHNVVHLLSGAVAIAAVSMSDHYARLYLIVFGVVYALVTVLGFVMGGDVFGLIHVNMADNYLHLAIAAVSLLVGFGSQVQAGSAAGGMGGGSVM